MANLLQETTKTLMENNKTWDDESLGEVCLESYPDD